MRRTGNSNKGSIHIGGIAPVFKTKSIMMTINHNNNTSAKSGNSLFSGLFGGKASKLQKRTTKDIEFTSSGKSETLKNVSIVAFTLSRYLRLSDAEYFDKSNLQELTQQVLGLEQELEGNYSDEGFSFSSTVQSGEFSLTISNGKEEINVDMIPGLGSAKTTFANMRLVPDDYPAGFVRNVVNDLCKIRDMYRRHVMHQNQNEGQRIGW